ncbi:MAG: hydrogenase maturation nickel metallochaperone HypA [Candidatus Omnitrophica bacterium]|nr:hydrogenase maturation nickel metallochaperone HypA [Candidatus Omnitrophota bacterium]MCM8808721.1 hydrogenase maturation nickel metallochaperone HypA [Candidatus Omnitrophota bacterium]MCM8810565.1 hydrogenase maturation nickel metallochaperone HypA [Candidatus Omnitrophota bacterium]MCM8832941.1 hydrogenase maturation nickel metallochaperone HypA [Candidatus Omnitrophota bacterium]
MHEISVVDNLIKILEKICEENKAKKVIKINLRINPYSCLDEENLNFIFSSITKENEILRKARIFIKKDLSPFEREYIIENIEMEV